MLAGWMGVGGSPTEQPQPVTLGGTLHQVPPGGLWKHQCSSIKHPLVIYGNTNILVSSTTLWSMESPMFILHNLYIMDISLQFQ